MRLQNLTSSLSLVRFSEWFRKLTNHWVRRDRDGQAPSSQTATNKFCWSWRGRRISPPAETQEKIMNKRIIARLFPFAVLLVLVYLFVAGPGLAHANVTAQCDDSYTNWHSTIRKLQRKIEMDPQEKWWIIYEGCLHTSWLQIYLIWIR